MRGLGSKLVLKSEELSIKRGCKLAYVMVTGKYSFQVFEKLGYTLENVVLYDEFRDSTGNLFLNDCREHTRCATVVKKLV